MGSINGINSGIDYSVFFGASPTQSAEGVDLTSYMSIKNGSYRRLMKDYYKSQKKEAGSFRGDSGAKLTNIRSSADDLQKKADALSYEKLWATSEKTDEGSGKNKEELKDPDSLVKALKGFTEAYNKTIDAAASSETKAVLRNGGWLDNMTRKNARLLNEVGITIGSDGKLSIDEAEAKNANVTTLKSLFKGTDSYAAKVSAKASAIKNAAAGTVGTYDSAGAWNKKQYGLSGSQIDSLVGSKADKESSSDKMRTEAENNIKTLKEKRDRLKKDMSKAVGYDENREYESQIKRLDKEIKEAENRLKYL